MAQIAEVLEQLRQRDPASNAIIAEIQDNFPRLLSAQALASGIPIEFLVWGYELAKAQVTDLAETYVEFWKSYEFVTQSIAQNVKDHDELIGSKVHKKLVFAYFNGESVPKLRAILDVSLYRRLAGHDNLQDVDLEEREFTEANYQVLANEMPDNIKHILERTFERLRQLTAQKHIGGLHNETFQQALADKNMAIMFQHVEKLEELKILLRQYANFRPKNGKDYEDLWAALYVNSLQDESKLLRDYYSAVKADSLKESQLNRQQLKALGMVNKLYENNFAVSTEKHGYNALADAYLYAKKALESNNKKAIKSHMQTYLHSQPNNSLFTRALGFGARAYNYFIGDYLHYARENPKKAALIFSLFLGFSILMVAYNPVEWVFSQIGSNMNVNVPTYMKVLNSAFATVLTRIVGQKFAQGRIGQFIVALIPRSALASQTASHATRGVVAVVKNFDKKTFEQAIDTLLQPQSPQVMPKTPMVHKLVEHVDAASPAVGTLAIVGGYEVVGEDFDTDKDKPSHPAMTSVANLSPA